ncbi:MAG: TonB-dependent receptor [Gammaproteobacteria bacterium]|nr:TonB-dependent receptor [Gammaproteobacteria bacterium]
MYIKHQLTLMMGLSACFGFPLFAQESSQLEEVVVIANRVPLPLRQIATSVTVLDEETLQAHGNFSLTDVLRQTTAVAVSSNGGIGSTSSLRIRGEEGFRTLTIIDGLKISDPSAPQVLTPFEHILSSGLGRVEILRGPQGLSYGADAGGVIAISSRPAVDGFAVNVEGQSGSNNSHQANLDVSAGNDIVDISLLASQFETDGYNVRESDSVLLDKDGYENDTMHARLGANINDNLRVQLVHRTVEGETQYDGCFAGTIVYACISKYELTASRIYLDYSGNTFTHSLAYSQSDTRRDDFASGSRAFGSHGEINRLEYIGITRDLPGFDLIFGIDLEEEVNGSLDRDNEGVYLEYVSDFSNSFFFTAGVRRDKNDDFGSHNSYRLTSTYLLELDNSQLKLKASYGSGFRAPSLFEVDYNASPFSFPPASNVQLSEEQSSGFEFGIEYLADRVTVEVVRFAQEVEDAIYFDLSGFSGYLQDIGNSTSEGIEISGSLVVSNTLYLSANYTYNDTERPNGLQRVRRPKQLANLGINYVSDSERLRINGFYRTSRDSIDEQFATPIDLDDFEVLDISASYRLSASIELFARVENVIDEKYQETLDYIAPERASYIGIRLNF